MPRRARIRLSENSYFRFENYFLNASESCAECPNEKQRPTHAHYHCLCCHNNYSHPKREGDLRYVLKHHYKFARGREEKAGKAPFHDLKNPPRVVAPKTFDDLNEEDKTLVREGKFTVSLATNIPLNCNFILFLLTWTNWNLVIVKLNTT